jgi:hypothetical protein
VSIESTTLSTILLLDRLRIQNRIQSDLKRRKAFVAPFILIRKDGKTWVYYDLSELAAAARDAQIQVHTYWYFYEHQSIKGPDGWKREYTRVENDFIVRDDRGSRVSSEDIRAALPSPTRRILPDDWWNRRDDEKRHASDLGLPIPGTGKRRRRYGVYYRHPKFASVHRAACALEMDDDCKEFRVKGRKIKLPPTNWDDIPRASLYNRNWKKFRKTKWK